MATDGGSARVRVSRPDADGPFPALLHIHDGGFVSGTPDSSHARNVELEGLAYAALLAEAGVGVDAHRFRGAFHAAFTAAPEAEVSRRYLAEEKTVLTRALGVTWG